MTVDGLFAAAVLFGLAMGGAFYSWGSDGFAFRPEYLPAALVTLDLLAALGYGVTGGVFEWRKVVYWLAAAILTFTVTW